MVNCNYFIGNSYIAGSYQITSAVLPSNKGTTFSTGIVPQLFAAILAIIEHKRCIVCTSPHGNYGIFDIEFCDIDVGGVAIYYQVLPNNHIASGFKIAYVDIACDTDYVTNELISIHITNSADQPASIDIGSG